MLSKFTNDNEDASSVRDLLNPLSKFCDNVTNPALSFPASDFLNT